MTTTTTTLNPTHRPLIAGVLARGPRPARHTAPVLKDLCPDRRPAPAPHAAAGAAAAAAARHGFSAAEQDAVRFAARDGLAADERAINVVVDRLLRELTW